MKFTAPELARGWLSAAIASGHDAGTAALYHTVCIEQFTDGVRLIATDSYMLLRCWIPSAAGFIVPEPDLDEAPTSTTVAIDAHGRAKGFLGYAYKLGVQARKDDAEDIYVFLDYAIGQPDGASQLPGIETKFVTLEMHGREKLRLPTYDGSWPTWRSLAHRAQKTGALALNPSIMGRLAKLGNIHPTEPIRFTFGGENRPIRVDIESDLPVTGLAMPIRWDIDNDRPAVGDGG